MIRALLVDDNEFIVNVLADVVKENHPDIDILGIARNGSEGIVKINQFKPDLVFLDIEMPDMNGYEGIRYLISLVYLEFCPVLQN